MKFHIDTFKSNNPNVKPSDIIKSVRYTESPEGVISVRISVHDKYYDIREGMYIFNPNKFKGMGLNIMPYIYENHECLDSACDNLDDYYNHDKWFMLNCVLETDDSSPDYQTTLVPLKHEYLWILIPNNLVFKYDEMDTLDIIEH